MIRGVLFDFDGVLAETLPFHLKAWKVVFNELNIQPDELSILLNEGQPAWKIAQAMAKKYSLDLDENKAKHYAHLKNTIFRKNKINIYPEIPDILNFCKQKDLKTGLVTGAVYENVKAVVPENLLSLFDVKICEGDYLSGKPSPDPYISGAEKLDLFPCDCLVVENAPLGIQSAKSAGCFCIAIMTTLHREHLAGADVILEDHKSLFHYLDNLVK